MPRGDTSRRRSRPPTWAILFAIAALARCTSNAGPAADVPRDDAGPRCDGAHCPAQCPADTADCDGDVSTGCETLTAFDPVNCGACGVVCRAGVPCLRGACGCRDGFSVCRAACVNLLDDALNCGACGVTCPLVDGARRCANGVCVGSCPPGRGDCDANPSNGCEVDVTASFVHCGACRVRCPIGSTCVGGVCRCGEGAVTCGRECVDTRSDARHCGACGHACVGGDCVDGRCVCPAGRVLCGTSRCVDTNSDAANCGRCDVVCAAAPRASAACREGSCTLRCDAGTGDCNGVSADGCEFDVTSDRDHCGACDVRCRADQVCRGACVCPVGLIECAGACVNPLTTTAHCGACGRPCPAGWSCEHGACNPACVAPLSRCGDACVATSSDAANCGACGHVCAVGQRCAEGACVPVARPIAPLSTSTTLSVRPLFRWQLPPTATGVRIQIYRDAACTVAVTDQIVTGDNWRPSSAMHPGTYFWRLVATRDGAAATVASPTWFFRVETRGDTPSGAGVTGANLDVDADGFADVAVSDTDTARGAGDARPRFFLYRGSPTGPSPDGWRLHQDDVREADFGGAVARAGDVNGDGHADLIVGTQTGFRSGFTVHLGTDFGLTPTAPRTVVRPDGTFTFTASVRGAGDVNGDGYADVMVSQHGSDGVCAQGFVHVFLGGPEGLAITPATTLTDHAMGSDFGTTLAGIGDVNGDGYSDIAVGASSTCNESTFLPGRVFVYLGGPSGITTDWHRVLRSSFGSTGGGFGYFVTAAGDLDGDGYADLATGGYHPRSALRSEDSIHIYRGGPSGLDEAPTAVLLGSGLRRLGWSAVGAGDLDGDGYGDLAVSRSDAPYGVTALHYGAPTGVSTTASRILPAAEMTDRYREYVEAADDLDGDGRSDLLVSRIYGASAVSVFLNSPTGLPEFPSTRLIAPLGVSGGFGFSLALLAPTSPRSLAPTRLIPPRCAAALTRAERESREASRSTGRRLPRRSLV